MIRQFLYKIPAVELLCSATMMNGFGSSTSQDVPGGGNVPSSMYCFSNLDRHADF